MTGKIELILYLDGRTPVAVSNPAPGLLENCHGPMSIASALRVSVEDLTERLAERIHEGRA